MFKKLLAPVLVVSLFISLCVSLPAQAAATKELKINKRNANEVSKIFENLKDKDPQKAISQKLSKDKRNPDELVSDQSETLQIKFSLKDKKIKLNNKLKGDLSLKIPDQNNFDSVDVIDNKVIYSGQNSKTDLIVESVEGGLRQIVNIKDASASSSYDFPMELDKNDKLELTENGGAVITTKDLNFDSLKAVDLVANLPADLDKNVAKLIKSGRMVKVIIGKPWAIDANKKELKTWYTLESNNILKQHIELKGAVFPVVADPIWCGNAISSVTWILRDGMWSASNKPTNCGAFNCGGQWACWQESYDKTPTYAYLNSVQYIVWNKQWNTNQYWSMYNQFICHADYPKDLKSEWNLEPARRDKGYWGFVFSGCN